MKFPSIEQFRHTVKAVQETSKYVGKDEGGTPVFDHTRKAPKLKAFGTTKIHGTNAGVRLKEDGTLECWSRTRVITPEEDNAGFAKFVMEREDVFKQMLTELSAGMVYGEWCGKGIMKGCAVHDLEKMFVLFAARRGEGWAPTEELSFEAPEARLFSVLRFGTWELDIDFESPEEARNELVRITQEVENECPLGKHFGVSGVGEGVVWQLVDPEYGSSFWFKVKGEKHSVTKVKKLVEVDLEMAKSVKEFANTTVTEARCQQGVAHLQEVGKPIDQKATGDFLKWVVGDVLKEEADRAENLDVKAVKSAVMKTAREWWFAFLDRV